MAVTSSTAIASPSPRFFVEAPARFTAYGDLVDLKAVAEASLVAAGCTVETAEGEGIFEATVDAAIKRRKPPYCEYAIDVEASDGTQSYFEPHTSEKTICSTKWLKERVAAAMKEACKVAIAGVSKPVEVPATVTAPSDPPPNSPLMVRDQQPLQPEVPKEESRPTWQRPVAIGLVVAGAVTLAAMAIQHNHCKEEVSGECKVRYQGASPGSIAAIALGLASVSGGIALFFGGNY